MVCYICGAPASAECRWCHRFVCAAHTRARFGSQPECTLCNERMEEDGKVAAAASRERERQTRWCDICGGPAEEDSCWNSNCGYSDSRGCRNYMCRVCNKYFCKKHGQYVTDDGTETWNEWYRCIDHLKLPGKLGRQSVKWRSIFMGSGDSTGSIY